jgi:hypothetical protein
MALLGGGVKNRGSDPPFNRIGSQFGETGVQKGGQKMVVFDHFVDHYL